MESNHNSSNRRLISVSIKVEIHPGITILKAQKKLLDVCGGDAKKFTYSIMEMSGPEKC